MIIEKLMRQADFTDVEKSIADYLLQNGYEVKICLFQIWRRGPILHRPPLPDFAENWIWTAIKSSRFCSIPSTTRSPRKALWTPIIRFPEMIPLSR